jgi:hypothetical protein
MKAANGSGPVFGSTRTILGGGGALDFDLDSDAAGAGAGAAAGAGAPSAFSFSETELLIASTNESNCCCESPAGGEAGVCACAGTPIPRASVNAKASVRRAFTIHILP